MSTIEFRTWPKIPRLNREMVITEKIDGSNASIGVVELSEEESGVTGYDPTTEGIFRVIETRDIGDVPAVKYFGLYAQSRSRLIMPGKSTDNYGFAGWVEQNAGSLYLELGVGLHFGEWWGSGINRGYGLPKDEKRFSLFNTSRYAGKQFSLPGLGVVPVLYTGPFDTEAVGYAVDALQSFGSAAAEGYMRPEGVVVYHTAANHCFKVTVEGDEQPKSRA